MVEEAIRRALAVLTESHAALDAQRADLERQVADVETWLNRIVSAITAGGALETLVNQLKTEEQQQKLLRAQLAQIEAMGSPSSSTGGGDTDSRAGSASRVS